MKQYSVLISGTAQRMLTEHVFFLAGINPSAAEQLRVLLLDQVRSLSFMPERFPYLTPEDRRSPYRKMFVPNNYLVLYVIEEDTVFVEYVLGCRSDYQWLLP